MHLRKLALRFTATALSTAVLLPALQAQDFYHGGVSARTAAMAGTYLADGTDVLDALAVNPAGLSLLNGPVVNSSLIAGLARGSFSDTTNDHSTMRSRPGFAPLGAFGAPLGHSRWTAGVGVSPDFLSAVNWHYADAPGTAGADYGPQGEKSQILAYRGSAGLAYAASDRLSFGASLGVVYNENILIAPYIFQENPQLAGLKTLLRLHTHGFAFGGSFGVMAHLNSAVMLTAAYTSPFAVTSYGHASGNLGRQFQAAGIPFAPAFDYDAQVRVKLPQSVIAGGSWKVTGPVTLSLQGDFVNFRNAFNNLPVSLSRGTNQDINGFLHSSSIRDEVPLGWSDQYTLRTALAYKTGERTQLDGGFVRRSSLVPNGTVTPLTGAIMKNELSAGVEHARQQLKLDAAYTFNFNQSATVGTSGLLAGEYDHSHLSVGTQALILSLSYQLKHSAVTPH